jgi:hypothetical protein
VRALFVLIAAAVLTPVALAAPVPDSHDRVLMAQLEAKVAQYERLGSNSSSDIDALMSKCGLAKKDPAQAFKVAFALLPVAAIELVQRYRGPFVDIRQTLGSMHPHSALFRSWVAAELRELDFLLRFDNGGKRIDPCKAAQVMLSEHPTAAQIKSTLGVDPVLLAQLVARSTTGHASDLKQLDPPMRKFFLAGGVSPKHADALTS